MKLSGVINYGALRENEYLLTRKVNDRLNDIDNRLKKIVGKENYKKAYQEHCDFIMSDNSLKSLSPLEKKYFNELIADVADLSEYNLERSNLQTTHKVMQAVIYYLREQRASQQLEK